MLSITDIESILNITPKLDFVFYSLYLIKRYGTVFMLQCVSMAQGSLKMSNLATMEISKSFELACMLKNVATNQYDKRCTLCVKRDHSAPLFWNYTLVDDEGEIIFSTPDLINRKNFSGKCILLDTRDGLPVGLHIEWDFETNSPKKEAVFNIEFTIAGRFHISRWNRQLNLYTSVSEYGHSVHLLDNQPLYKDIIRLINNKQDYYHLSLNRGILNVGGEFQRFDCHMEVVYGFDALPTENQLATASKINGKEITSCSFWGVKKESRALQINITNHALVLGMEQMLSLPKNINLDATLVRCFSFDIREDDLTRCFVRIV